MSGFESGKPRILFYANSWAIVPEFWHLIVAAREHFDVHLASRAWPAMISHARAHQGEIVWHILGPAPKADLPPPEKAAAPKATQAPTRPSSPPARTFLNDIREMKGLVRDTLAARREVSALFARIQPSAVVSAADNNYGYEQLIMSEAARRGVPRHVIQTMGVARDPLADMMALRPGHRQVTSFDRVVDKLFPEQVLAWDGVPVRIATSPAISVYSMLGARPAHPWVWGGSWATAVHVDGEEETRQLGKISHGATLPIHVTGRASLDDMFQRAAVKADCKRQFCAAAGIPEPDGRILIVAMTQFAEHDQMGWDQHWLVTRARASILRDLAERTGVTVIISLHPRMAPAEYEFLSYDYGLIVSPWSLREVLPIADAFCAGFSDTVIWALDLQIPTVVLAQYYSRMIYQEEPVDLIATDDDMGYALERVLADGPWRSKRLDDLSARLPRFANRGRATAAQLDLLRSCIR